MFDADQPCAASDRFDRRVDRTPVLLIQAGPLEVAVNERAGGEIVRVGYHGEDVVASYDWASPVAVSTSCGYGDDRLDWLSEYRGGWQFLIPNAGAACTVDGTPLPFHGEWSRTHVDVVAREPDRVAMTAGLRLPLTVEREVRVATDPDRVVVDTTVTNTAPAPVPFVWGEHPAFIVESGDRVDFPTADICDADGSVLGRWPAPTDGDRRLDLVDTSVPHESVHYLVGFEQGWAALRRRRFGLALAWDVADYPYAWIWHECGSQGYPFFGRASLVAIEPASSWPGTGLADAIERGQATMLAPGEQKSTSVSLIPFTSDGRAVASASVTGHVEFTT